MNKRMDTVLVTGALGFIPSSLCEGLLNQGYQVVGIDNFLTGDIRNISQFKENSNFTFVRGDVNNYQHLYKVFYTHDIKYIYHYAACVGVQRTLNHPRWVLRDIDGFKNITQLSREFNIEKILFSSSSEVYGEPVEFPQVEEVTPLNSQLPYAVVKNLGEIFFKTNQLEFDIPYTVFRFFNTYGPRQSKDFVVSKFILQALSHKNLTIYGDGSQTRTFCYIDDNIDSTIAALVSEKAHNRVINIGSNIEISILALAKLIIKLCKSKSKIIHLPALKEGDMTRRKPETSRMLELINGRDLKSLEEGLKNTIAYFRTNL